MNDVGAWLERLGLAQYAERFRANGVDLRALPHLTDGDLEALGVLLGHRRLMRAALAETSPAPAGGLDAGGLADDGERRLLTVMFADLVGSSRLAEALDVEDYQALIRTYQDATSAAVAPFGGYVAKFLGDGALVYFGYPYAYGDDAARAVRAGRAVVAAVTALATPTGRPLAVRIGIATGEVVVGDLVGAGSARERSVLGVAPNVAARLQAVADPNAVVIADATRRAIPRGLALTDLGVRELAGIAEPVQAWRVDDVEDAPGPAAASPFVGRDDVLRNLLALWRDAVSEARLAVAHIAGEPGIGKTRLLEALRTELAGADIECWRCSAFDRNVPLHPLPSTLRSTLAVAGGAATEGEGRRRAALAAIVARLQARAAVAPLLLLVEDAHWIDPTTAELLEALGRELADVPVLLTVAARPGREADQLTDALGGLCLELVPLGATEAEAVVDAFLPAGVAPSVRADIVARAGGLPLFLEELARVVASGEDRAVPATLEQSLLARLDALGTAKALAQLAAVLGEGCSRAELARFAELDDAALGLALEQLQTAGILVAAGDGFVFRHALIRDVAYDTLLRRHRRRLHGDIADRLVQAAPAASPEVVARHLSGADRHGEAAGWWLEAGRRSAALWAHAEAVACFEAGLRRPDLLAPRGDGVELALRLALAESLRILERCEAGLAQLELAAPLITPDDDAARLRLHVLRGNLLFPLGDAGRCIAAHEAALTVARRMADPKAEARALSGIGDGHFAGRRLVSAERAYDRCVAIAEGHGLDAIVLANLSLRGHMRLYLKRLVEAREDCERALAMAVARGDRRGELVARGSCLGRVHLEAGEFSAAARAFEAAARQARELTAERYEALNLVFAAMTALDGGRRGDAAEAVTRAIELEREAGRRYCLPIALAVAARAEPDGDAGASLLAEGAALLRGGSLAHNHFWFYRNAILAAANWRAAGEVRRFREALLASFAEEPVPLAEEIAAGAWAIATALDGSGTAALDAASAHARGDGLQGWARVLTGLAAVLR